MEESLLLKFSMKQGQHFVHIVVYPEKKTLSMTERVLKAPQADTEKIVQFLGNIDVTARFDPFKTRRRVGLANFKMIAVEQQINSGEIEIQDTRCFGGQLFDFRRNLIRLHLSSP